jgi:hypothetical protein
MVASGGAQIGRTLRKKRAQPAHPCASACAPRPRCSSRTLAIWCWARCCRAGWRAGPPGPRSAARRRVVDADLLLAGHQQVAVGQHLAHHHGDGAGEVVAVLGGALAGEGVAAGGLGRGAARSAWALDAGSAVTPASSVPLLSTVLVRLLAGADLLDDLHRQRVAHQARAVVLEQRPVGGRLEDRPGGPGGTGARLAPAGAAWARTITRGHAGSTIARQPASGSRPAAARQAGGGRSAGGAHHSCPSFCSIWSEVWMALEFSS